MREIKFRALYEGVWYYQALEEIITVTLAAFRLGKHKTQYTGLKDKNGVEIYEGDIVQGVLQKPELMKGNIITGQVEYEAHGCRFIVVQGSQDSGSFTGLQQFGETLHIIGNIYENPELLTP